MKRQGLTVSEAADHIAKRLCEFWDKYGGPEREKLTENKVKPQRCEALSMFAELFKK